MYIHIYIFKGEIYLLMQECQNNSSTKLRYYISNHLFTLNCCWLFGGLYKYIYRQPVYYIVITTKTTTEKKKVNPK